MSSTDDPAGTVSGPESEGPGPALGFSPELLEIWADPEVRKLAAWRAGDPDLAQDALLEAVYAVARVGDLDRILDLKAYFCRVLINKSHRMRSQLAAAGPYDPAAAPASPPPDGMATTRLLAQAWRRSFSTDRDGLRDSVPGRSPEPDRYRALIVRTAEHILCTALDGSVSWADCNEALQAALPDWFGRPGSHENTCHKHLSRARGDIRDVLRAVVRRDDLLP